MTAGVIRDEDIEAGRWWPRANFSHLISKSSNILGLGTDGGFAVDFKPIGHTDVEIHLEGWQSLEMSVWSTSTRSGFESHPRLQADVAVVRFVTSGSMSRSERDASARIDAGMATLNTFDLMKGEIFSENFSALTVSLSKAVLERAILAIDEDSAGLLSDLQPVADTDQSAIFSLKRAARFLSLDAAKSLLNHPAGLLLLQDVFANHVAAVWPRREGAFKAHQSRPASAQTVRRALEFIDAYGRSPITLNEIARAAGTGVRNLQIAFKTELGTTPLRYLIGFRLDNVRNELVRTDSRQLPIKEVAKNWCFDHQGDFSRRYRDRFGETPSETRRTRLLR